MQTVAKYLLERVTDLETDAQREADRQRILDLLRQWLKRKGASDPTEPVGEFTSKTPGAVGEFEWQSQDSGDKTWDLLRLEEISPDEEIYETQVSVTKTDGGLFFYLTLAHGFTHGGLAHNRTDPRCPHIVRDVLKLSGDWFHGPTKLLELQSLTGRDSGHWLADQISDETRTIPLIVVSERNGEPLLPGAAKEIARDTAGIANVYTIDEAAAWGITDRLGKAQSCFLGAVRLYWPRLDAMEDNSDLWTEASLFSKSEAQDRITTRLRNQIRRSALRASALSVERPFDIDLVRVSGFRAQFEELQKKAESVDDYKGLLQLAEDENASLRDKNESLERQLQALQARVHALDVELRRSENADEELPPERVEPRAKRAEPGSGEIRFYKKIGSAGKRDQMVRRKDCGHNAWQNANKADKAKKGIEHLEGSCQWDNLWHCGTCEGGGVWKVRW